MLKVFNTLTRKLEDFKPINPPEVGFYSCGPTVYDFAHIGHARTFIFADILQRVLELDGYKVKRVMNITDVGHLTSDSDSGEDKMEKGAKREGKSVWEIAEFYTADFFAMTDKLNIKRPDIICKATDYIKEMIQMVQVLEKKGFTYKISDGIYFDTSKFPDYGKLTGQSFDSLQKTLKAGARVEVVSGKKYPTDFALWKFSYLNGRSFDSTQDDVSKKRQMEWDSPFVPTQGRGEGKGFPGWHIECSAMSMKFLCNLHSQTIDIHTGGVDHIPIHHTNEIAQSEGVSGKTFVNYWLHAEHLLVDGEKMSKSLKNFYRLKDLEEKGFRPLVLRYLFLTANYRTQMNFTWEVLEGAQRAFDGLRAQISNIKFPARIDTQNVAGGQISNNKGNKLSEEKLKIINNFREKFYAVINDDLNTAQALAVVWEVLKSNIPFNDKYNLLLEFDEVLGLDFNQITDNKVQITIPEEIKALVEKREELRKEKKWDETDKLRSQIENLGFIVVDTPQGSRISRK